MRVIWAVLSIVLGLSACNGDATAEPEPVGQIVVHWDESQNQPVGDDALSPGATLLRYDAEFADWVASLPTDMREDQATELDAVSLAEHVAVVAVWDRCVETSQVFHDGDGSLRFEVIFPEEHIVCAWSPRQVEVWLVPLEGMDRDQVTLA